MAPKLGLVITQRDEGALLRAQVLYHLACGVAHIVVVDNDSANHNTIEVLLDLGTIRNVTVIRDDSALFDQERLANLGIHYLLTGCGIIDWIMSLDVDEFLAVHGDLTTFLVNLEDDGTVYASIRTANNIPDRLCIQRPSAPPYLGSASFYLPEPERRWQEIGHFAKALCRAHNGMMVSVGNHYFYHAPLVKTFSQAPYTPVAIGIKSAVLLHYEMRDAGTELLQKWNNLGSRHVIPGAAPQASWWEKRDIMLRRAQCFRREPERLYDFIVRERRTLWGSRIRQEQMCRYTAVADALLL